MSSADMPALPAGRRFADSSPPTPGAVRVAAMAMLIAAGLGFVLASLHNASQNESALDGFGRALAKEGSPEAVELARTLKRTRELRKGMDDTIDRKVSLAKPHGQADRAVELLTSLLLVVGGLALWQRREFGRPVALLYCGISLAQKLANGVYLAVYEVPARLEYLKSQERLYPADVNFIKPLADEYSKGAINQGVLALFPLAILVVMLLSSTRDYLQRPAESEPEPPMPPGDGKPPSVEEIENVLRQRLGR